MPLSHDPRYVRARRRLSLRFRPVGSDNAPRVGFTEDFSQTGVFVQTTSPYGAGSLLEIEFDGQDGPITVRGKVMWAKRAPASLAQNKRSGMGIRLIAAPSVLLELAGLL